MIAEILQQSLQLQKELSTSYNSRLLKSRELAKQYEKLKNETTELEQSLRLSKKELKKVIKQYEKAQTGSRELQALKKKSQDLADLLRGKTTAANNLKQLSKGVINNKHILQ